MSTLARPAGKIVWMLGAAAVGALPLGLRWLWARDPDLARLLTAPPDDEPVTVEDVVAVRESVKRFQAGQIVPGEKVLAELESAEH